LNVQVEILDVFDSPEGKLAVVQAVSGKPFVGGDKWPVATPYATVPAADLVDVAELAAGWPQPQPSNLLALALAAARPQWPNFESVWLVGGPSKGAYLKNVGGWVYLFASGYAKGLPVFYLDPAVGEWKESRRARKEYQAWAAEARQAIDCGNKVR
jgi:hypothetical protein